MEMNFDPITGEPMENTAETPVKTGFDPMTGQPVTGGAEPSGNMGFDPMTGQPVTNGAEPSGNMGFAPMTGQPITSGAATSGNMGFDPMTGQPVTNGAAYGTMGFDPMTGQPIMGTKVPKRGGIGKTILMVAAPAAVVGVVVFAGIKSGLFLGKSGKVMLAVSNTLNDSSHLAEDLNFADILDSGKYTVEVSGEMPEGSLELAYSASSSEKAVRGALDISGIPSVEFRAALDSEALKLSVPTFSSQVFSYYYESENDGYLMSMMGRDEIEALNSSLKTLYSNDDYKDMAEDLKDSITDEIKSLDFSKVSSQSYEVNGSSRTCKGYMTTITSDNLLNILDDMEDVFTEGMEAQYDELFGEAFSEMRSGIRYMEDLDLTFYIYKNKLACINLAVDGDDMEILFLGGDTRMQNMEVRADGRTMMEIKGSTDGGIERSRIYAEDEEVMDLEYDYKSGDFSVDMADALYCRGNIQSGGSEFSITLDRLDYAYGYGSVDINGTLSIKKGKMDIDLDGDEFDIGNASLSDLEELGAGLSGLLGGMGSF